MIYISYLFKNFSEFSQILEEYITQVIREKQCKVSYHSLAFPNENMDLNKYWTYLKRKKAEFTAHIWLP